MPTHRMVALCAIAIAFSISACSSVSTTVYHKEEIGNVKSWLIDFTYEPGRIERRAELSGEAEVKSVTEGRPARHLQLRDDIYYSLKDKHQIASTRDSAQGSGEIRMHIVDDLLGSFRSLDVALVGPQGETLARVRIKNGVPGKHDEEFAKYCADAIADVILNRPKTKAR